MKKINLFTLLFCTILFACSSDAEHSEEAVSSENEQTEEVEEAPEVPKVQNTEMNVEITFDGSPITVNNPYSSTGVGFCVKQVFIDENESDVDVSIETFAIDVSEMGLEEGQVINLRIVHEEQCLPEVVTNESAEE